jgi:hypothetical protein
MDRPSPPNRSGRSRDRGLEKGLVELGRIWGLAGLMTQHVDPLLLATERL